MEKAHLYLCSFDVFIFLQDAPIDRVDRVYKTCTENSFFFRPNDQNEDRKAQAKGNTTEGYLGSDSNTKSLHW